MPPLSLVHRLPTSRDSIKNARWRDYPGRQGHNDFGDYDENVEEIGARRRSKSCRSVARPAVRTRWSRPEDSNQEVSHADPIANLPLRVHNCGPNGLARRLQATLGSHVKLRTVGN